MADQAFSALLRYADHLGIATLRYPVDIRNTPSRRIALAFGGKCDRTPESRFNARSSHAVSGSVSDPLPPKYNRRRLSACGGILCFRFICLWQRYDERRAFAHFAFYLNIPFHAHYHMLYNGKPQPGAAGGAAASFIHAVKALEQPRDTPFPQCQCRYR